MRPNFWQLLGLVLIALAIVYFFAAKTHDKTPLPTTAPAAVTP